MSAQFIQVLAPLPALAPLGAVWAGQAAVWLVRRAQRFGRRSWVELQACGHRRVARELLLLAQRYQGHHPALAQSLRSVAMAALNHTIKELT